MDALQRIEARLERSAPKPRKISQSRSDGYLPTRARSGANLLPPINTPQRTSLPPRTPSPSPEAVAQMKPGLVRAFP